MENIQPIIDIVAEHWGNLPLAVLLYFVVRHTVANARELNDFMRQVDARLNR